MTPSASPSSDTSMPGFPSRALVDLLLEEGEQTALQDAVAIETDDLDYYDDIVSGWGCSASLPKPPVKPHRNKKGSKVIPTDIDITNIRIRCVSEDYSSDHHRSSWKANVEPGTYRYISNNGIYRSTKFASAGNDWVTVKRSKHLETTTGLMATPEVRQAQKTLKKDLGQMIRSTDTAKSEPRNPEKVSSKAESLPTPKPIKSSSAVAIGDPSDRPVTRDAFKDPKLVKSTSDLFVEKFSTRMDALQKSEKEMLGTPLPRTPITPSKLGANPSSNSSKRQEHSSSDLAQQSTTDDIAKDVFTVKPVTRPSADQPLRPLEKLTPQQKNMDRGSMSECSSHNSRSEPETPVLPSSFMNAMNAFAQLHHHNFRGKDSKNRSGPSTYRSRHKNSLGNVSASSNFSDSDSLNSVRNALTMTNSSIERMRMRPYGRDFSEKDYAVKDYGKFLTGNGKYKLGTSSKRPTRPPQVHVQRKGIVGYRPTITQSHTQTSGPVAMTTTAVSRLAPSIQPIAVAPSVEEVRSNISDSSESYLSGTSMKVHRGSGSLTESKPGGMALPEISGKRLTVPMSSQRLL